MWNKKVESLGNIQAQKQIKIQFTYIGDIDVEVNTITTPCSCTTPSWNKDTNTMTIIWTPKPVPHHLKNQLHKTNYTDVKTVTFQAIIDGVRTQQQLSVTAIIFDVLPNN